MVDLVLEPSTRLALKSEGVYPKALLDEYNIVLLDQRGTGYSAFAHDMESGLPCVQPFMGTQAYQIEALRQQLQVKRIRGKVLQNPAH